MINITFKNKKLFLIFTLAVILVCFIALLFISNIKPTTNIPFNKQSPAPTKPKTLNTPGTELQKTLKIQKTIIGKTTSYEVESLGEIEKKDIVSSTETKYSLNSPIYPLRANEIITKDDVVVFERVITPSIFSEKIIDYEDKYGPPEEIIKGSKYYDWYMETHIYAKIGFAFIANPNTKEIFEFQFFPPTTVDGYIRQYGQDLNPGAGPARDGLD